MELSAVLTPAPEGGYTAFNPETGTTTQGETLEEALTNLREASVIAGQTHIKKEQMHHCRISVILQSDLR